MFHLILEDGMPFGAPFDSPSEGSAIALAYTMASVLKRPLRVRTGDFPISEILHLVTMPRFEHRKLKSIARRTSPGARWRLAWMGREAELAAIKPDDWEVRLESIRSAAMGEYRRRGSKPGGNAL
jgi:hypothetical protein